MRVTYGKASVLYHFHYHFTCDIALTVVVQGAVVSLSSSWGVIDVICVIKLHT